MHSTITRWTVITAFFALALVVGPSAWADTAPVQTPQEEQAVTAPEQAPRVAQDVKTEEKSPETKRVANAPKQDSSNPKESIDPLQRAINLIEQEIEARDRFAAALKQLQAEEKQARQEGDRTKLQEILKKAAAIQAERQKQQAKFQQTIASLLKPARAQKITQMQANRARNQKLMPNARIMRIPLRMQIQGRMGLQQPVPQLQRILPIPQLRKLR